MAAAPQKEKDKTPANKRPRTVTRGKNSIEKKKRLSSSSIATITRVDFESSEENEEYEMTQEPENQAPQGQEFPVRKQNGGLVMSDLERMLDKRFSVLATSAQVERMGDRIKRNEDEINTIKVELQDLNRKISNVARVEEEGQASPRRIIQARRPVQGRENAYDIARRSIRLWPIEGDSDDEVRKKLDEFCLEALKMTRPEIREITIEKIRRTRTSPNATAFLEICVTYQNVDDRDYVMAKARNLGELVDDKGKPTAGMRMEVPGYLMSVFRDLNNYAYLVRKSGGKGSKTYTKFDDTSRSLYLEVKIPSSDSWLRITPEKARELIVESTSKELRELQKRMGRRNSARSESSSYGESDFSSSQNVEENAWRPPGRSGRMGFGN